MTTPSLGPRIGALALGLLAAAPLPAQETTTDRVAADTDWSAFAETDPTQCFAVSAPTAQENTRDGQPVTVQRGETQLFVMYQPQDDVEGQVVFTGGYPFAPDSTVTLEVAGSTFNLFVDGEWAYAVNSEEDTRIVEALKVGTEAVLEGRSARGTVTRDTFSLLGFTDMVERAKTSCPAG